MVSSFLVDTLEEVALVAVLAYNLSFHSISESHMVALMLVVVTQKAGVHIHFLALNNQYYKFVLRMYSSY